MQGPRVCGSVDGFTALFDAAPDPDTVPDTVFVDFVDSRVAHQSARQAIEAAAGRDEAEGKTLRLRPLSRDCHRLLTRAGPLVADRDDDPDRQITVDYGVRTGIIGGHWLAAGMGALPPSRAARLPQGYFRQEEGPIRPDV